MKIHLKKEDLYVRLGFESGFLLNKGRLIISVCNHTCISPIPKQKKTHKKPKTKQSSSLLLYFTAALLSKVPRMSCLYSLSPIPLLHSPKPSPSACFSTTPLNCSCKITVASPLGNLSQFHLCLTWATVSIGPCWCLPPLNHFLPLTSKTPLSPGVLSTTFAVPTATSPST